MDMKLQKNIVAKQNHIKFHMPGHKGRMLPAFPWEAMDTTELDGTDNLNDPTMEIQSLERDIARIYGSSESMISVNGSTSCIMASLLGMFEPGDKIIVPRNVHKSVYSGLFYGRLSPVYVQPYFGGTGSYPVGVRLKDFEAVINAHPDAKGAVITYPTYYGTCDDIEGIVKICRERGVLLVVDEAHGAHFHFADFLPVSALDAGADIVIHSTHKTLSSLNPGALLHVNDPGIDSGRIRRHLSMLQTSSPSYPVILSVALAVKWMEEHGLARLSFLSKMYELVRSELRESPFPFVRDLKDLSATDWDPTKLWFSSGGIHGLSKILSQRFQIDVEWEDGETCLAMSGVGSIQDDFEQLMKALKCLSTEHQEENKGAILKRMPFPEPGEKILEIYDRMETQTVLLEEAEGRVAADFLTPYPPGIPVICPGEIITREAMDYIQNAGTMSTLGLDAKGRVQVCKEER